MFKLRSMGGSKSGTRKHDSDGEKSKSTLLAWLSIAPNQSMESPFPAQKSTSNYFHWKHSKCWTLILKRNMLFRGLLFLFIIKMFIFNLIMQKIGGKSFSMGYLFLMILMLDWVLMFPGWDIYWAGAENMEDFRKFPVVKSILFQ